MMAKEQRLIDAEDFAKHLERMARTAYQDMRPGLKEAAEYAKDFLTVDAVEVVRCKDCTEWGGVPFGNVCRRWSAPLAGMKNCTGPDDYCSYGERRGKDAVD